MKYRYKKPKWRENKIRQYCEIAGVTYPEQVFPRGFPWAEGRSAGGVGLDVGRDVEAQGLQLPDLRQEGVVLAGHGRRRWGGWGARRLGSKTAPGGGECLFILGDGHLTTRVEERQGGGGRPRSRRMQCRSSEEFEVFDISRCIRNLATSLDFDLETGSGAGQGTPPRPAHPWRQAAQHAVTTA